MVELRAAIFTRAGWLAAACCADLVEAVESAIFWWCVGVVLLVDLNCLPLLSSKWEVCLVRQWAILGVVWGTADRWQF